MSKKILHLTYLDKFIPGFIELIRNNFTDEPHTIITFGNIKKYPFEPSSTVLNFRRFKIVSIFLLLIKSLHCNDKIILHGLFSPRLVMLLCFMPWLHKKCNWIIWGGDLYYHKLAVKNIRYYIREFFRRILISRLGGFITYVDGDYHNAQKWYGAKGRVYECIMYKSNIYSGMVINENNINHFMVSDNENLNIQVGNSADPTNNHKIVFDKLVKLDIKKISKIYCPLSYGNITYAAQIKKLGEAMFGDKFHPLMDFMPLEQYNKILDEVDIAIFAHNRQQAMGNTINLLGRGKTVYMQPNTSSYALLTKLGIKVYSLDDLNLSVQAKSVTISNNHQVRHYFSEENLVNQLKAVFY